MYEIKILLKRGLNTPLFCTHALRSSLECEVGTAVEPFREKNSNLPVIKSSREGIICLYSLPSLNYLFSAAILLIKEMLSVSVGTMIGQ